MMNSHMTFGIVANLNKRAVWRIVPKFLAVLQQKGIEAIVASDVYANLSVSGLVKTSCEKSQLGAHCNIVIAFGGDGTMLSTARDVARSGVPILGVNVGRFGFLAEISVDELYSKIDDLIAGSYDIEDRMALEAVLYIEGGERQCYAFNDVVLDKGKFPRTILIETYIDNEYLNTYNADGIIISSPTGSTAYSLSASGPLLSPDMDALLITPICPHSLSQRPLVIKEDKVVKIKAWSEHDQMLFSVDGQDVATITAADIIEVRKSPTPVRLVKCSGKSFFQVLRTKLNWGEDKKLLSSQKLPASGKIETGR